MNAHNDVKRLSDQSLNARLVLAAAQLRIAALVDFLVARWLARCATNAGAIQGWFKIDRKPTGEFELGKSCRSLSMLGANGKVLDNTRNGGRLLTASLTPLQIATALLNPGIAKARCRRHSRQWSIAAAPTSARHR